MRQNNTPASASTPPVDEEAGDDDQSAQSFAVASSLHSYQHSHAPNHFMSQHGQPSWSQTVSASASNSSESTDAMHDTTDDHDMADDDVDIDLEEGGVPLTGTHTSDSDIISPFTGSAIFTQPSYETTNFDDSISLDGEYEMPPIAPLGPVIEPGLPSPTPTPPGMGISFAQLMATTVPAWAQQVLPSIPAHQAQAHEQVPAQLAAQHPLLVQQQQQQLFGQQQLQFFNDLDDEFGDAHGALPMSNSNHFTLGPDNLSLADFLRAWARSGRPRHGEPVPRIDEITTLLGNKTTNRIEYEDLVGDAHDFQGIDWTQLEAPRSKARDRRRATYRNFVNKAGSDKWHPGLPDKLALPRDNLYRFQSMDIRRDVRLLHFQLRNILACASRTRAFFPSFRAIAELDPTTGRTRKAMDFGLHSEVQVSTVAATDEVLVAGSFLGDYRYRNLDSEDRSFTEGKLTEHISGITNHVQIHAARRSSAPIAAFASNDFGFRTVDLTTNKLLFESMYDFPLNCSAISTDQRLRVMVGDDTNVLITDAETGETLQALSGHRDFGFACDWAPDGWTVATGFQDKSVRIWDARRWTNNHDGSGAPIAVLRMDMSGARSLRFSPLGSGKRTLVAAEEADVINIFDAQTFNTQQKIEMFGEIGGTAFADDGRTLMALNTDPHRGGVLQFEKCDAGEEDVFNTNDWDTGYRQWPRVQAYNYDWVSSAETLDRPASLETRTERRRRAAVRSNLEPF